MSEIGFGILSLINEAVIIAKGSRIELVNNAAISLLGSDCTGKRLSSVLGTDIASAQSTEYTANVYLAGKSCILRASKRGSITTFVLREEARNTEIINDAFISSMRASLNLLTVSAERCRGLNAVDGSPVLKDALSSLTKNIYVTARHVSNLAYAKSILSGELEFAPRLTDLTELCLDCSMQSQSMVGAEISVEGPSSLICAVDTVLFAALYANLIANAITHGKADRISVRLIDGGEIAILAVSDNGAGIPADKLSTVFERYRAPFSTSEMYNGAGLGLTVVRGIAGKHGGTMLLESREGQGTSVHVSLRKNPAGVSLRSSDDNVICHRELLVGLSECISEKDFGAEYLD